MSRPGESIHSNWADRLSAGDRRSIARALTAVENDTGAVTEILAQIAPLLGSARVIGFTGPPGAGKSTLVGECIRWLRHKGISVGVVAVDPSSPYSGGAVLGDRIRMHAHSEDPEVFIRSVATRGHLGGLCLCAARFIDVLDAAGKEVILLETVGTGQSEVEVAEVADLKVVVMAPGLGDQVQTLKAGVLEIADLLVVNKSDQAYAERCEADLRQMLGMRPPGAVDVPIMRTNALSGEGVDGLLTALLDMPQRQSCDPAMRIRRALINETRRIMDNRLANEGRALEQCCQRIQKGEISLEEGAQSMLKLFDSKNSRSNG
jgi:LAO/AO transport system kinase